MRFKSDIEGYQAWQAGNRQRNTELLEFERMKSHYAGREDEMPYKTLAGFRRARRAQAESYKKIRQNLYEDLTIDKSDVIITNENIKRAFGEKTLTLQETIKRADGDIVKAIERYQSKLKIIDAHYKQDKNYWKNHPVGREAFAHFTSILATNIKMKELYEEIFPKSFKIYKEIIKQ